MWPIQPKRHWRSWAQTINVATGHLHYLYGDLTHAESEQIAHALLGNPLIQRLDIWSYQDWVNADRFAAPSLPKVILERNRPPFECIDVERPMSELRQQSVDNCWALSEAELAHIQIGFAVQMSKPHGRPWVSPAAHRCRD